MDNFQNMELSEDIKEQIRAKQVEIEKILEALEKLDKSKEWKTLQELLFKTSVEAIERQVKNEALAPKIDVDKLYRLQGEYAWARQYMDIPSFISSLKTQLQGIKQKLK